MEEDIGNAVPVLLLLIAAPPPQAGDARAQQAPPPSPTQAAPPATAPPADDITVIGRSRRGDPLAPLNAKSFDAAQSVDRAFFGPAALAYRKRVPGPLRSGLRNFLGNLREPVVFVNFLLQLKPGKAGETLGRFAINTTAGALGLIDIAKRRPFGLPRRRNGFANTLGFYGVRPGPFFFLPLLGATTLRDLTGNLVDQGLVPVGPIRPFQGEAYTIPVAVLSALDYRAEFDEELTEIRARRDPYAALRQYYLARRQAEIDALRGRRPAYVAPERQPITAPAELVVPSEPEPNVPPGMVLD